jgi:hypothetical protein
MSLSYAAPIKVQGAVRRKEAIDLRMQGCTYLQIGSELGVTKERARQLVKESLDSLNEATAEQTVTLRAEEDARLLALMTRVWPQVEEGNLKAIATAVKIIERRCKLWGLDAPTKVAVSSESSDLTNLSDEELTARCLRYGIAVEVAPYPGVSLPDPQPQPLALDTTSN